MNFAVIKTGGKQYKVAANDVLKIEKLGAQPGDVVTFDEVLMVGGDDGVTVGTPLVGGASVAAHLVATRKSRTVLIVKKHRRQHFDRRNGHRQQLSTVRIGEILLNGARTTLTADEKLRARAAALANATDTAVEVPEPAKAKAPAVSKAAPETKAKKPAPKAGAPKTAEPDVEDKPAKAAPRAKKAGAGFTDDISLISGVGATLTKKLAAAGVTSLTQIAAWTEADLARYDEELALHGRATRDEWVAQAKDLVAGRPPRAKVDQEHAADKAKK